MAVNAQPASPDPASVTLADVRARVDASLNKPRPRLMPLPPGEELRRRLAADPALADYAAAIRAQADKVLGEPLLERVMTGRRLLSVSRSCLDRIVCLDLAWRLTGDRRYADRAAAEARKVCGFTDWNPSHFLDTAEMSLAVALCLDGFHDVLDPKVRDELADALMEKGLRISLNGNNGWVRANNNWGQVCHGGLTAAALAIMDRDPELAAFIIHRAVVNVPQAMHVYNPSGGYPEGPGYWHYGTIFNVVLIDCLESGLGTDFGLSRLPGFDRTGQYIQVMAGPAFDQFNYADGWAGRKASTLVYWFSRRFGTGINPALPGALEADWKARAPGGVGKAPVAQDRFYMEIRYALQRPESIGTNLPPLDWQDQGEVPVAVHRGSWTNPEALFLGIKAGSPAHNHGQMDTGSFVLDAGGVRWAIDLGAEDYHRIESRGMNLWDRKQTSDRWRIFRLNSLSHNTLVIDGQPQHAAGKALITAFSDDPANPGTTVDLTPVYQGQAARVTRTFSMPGREKVVIRDRLEGLKPGVAVRWGMMTKAAVTVDGTRAVLREAGKALAVEAMGDVPVSGKVIDTATPREEFDSPNPGTSMLAFEAVATDTGIVELTVSLDLL